MTRYEKRVLRLRQQYEAKLKEKEKAQKKAVKADEDKKAVK